MITTCAALGCEEPASQRCSICKSVRYCSRECQRQHWTMEHKETCAGMASRRYSELTGLDPFQAHPSVGRSSVGIVTICDSQVQPDTILPHQLPPVAGGNGWEPCPVPNILGVPIVMKRISPCQCEICAGGRSPVAPWPQPTMQVATRLAIEAHTGLAPRRWMGSGDNHLGIVAVARIDYHDFGVHDWAILDDYICGPVLDSWGMDPPERDVRLAAVCNTRAYADYVARRRQEATFY